MQLAKKILGTIINSKDISTISKDLSETDKTIMRTCRVTQTKKLLKLHSNLFVIQGRKVSKTEAGVEILREENIEMVKEIRKTSKITQKGRS